MVTLAAVVAGGAILNVLGKSLVEKVALPRLLWWALLLLPFAAAHFVLLEQAVLARVVDLCVVLLLGMKIIVYMEWVKGGGRPIPLRRWLAFSFLWFGMEPRAWVGKRKREGGRLEWKSHVAWAAFCISLGAVGLSAVAFFEIRYFPLAFIFMSMMFHFGVLRLNTAFWRWAGFPVRTLFRNPLVTKGFGDFWGARWNLAYSQMMARAVKRPLAPAIGKKPAVFVVFLVSGVFHEFAITVPTMSGYGWPTLFFVLHGLAMLVEGKGAWLRYACLLALLIGLPILFPTDFVENVIWPIQNVWKQWINVW